MKLLLTLLLLSSISFGQREPKEIEEINKQIDSINLVKSQLMEELEFHKLQWIQDEIIKVGTPKSEIDQEIISHSAYQLSYNEEHEQANWVMHIILPDIINGNVSRSNDFRIDPLIKTGSAQESDYFLKKMKADSSYEYDGFGFDRGHLAPSADFRWSKKALSESYYYSNMSPQIGDFNRQKWASLENWIREYVTINNVSLIIVTAPVLNDKLQKSKRSINHISIPEYFIKVALDKENKRGIGFILPHKKIDRPLESYAVSIDSVEKILGYDLFSELDENFENEIESQLIYQPWLPIDQKGDLIAIPLSQLPDKAFNTNGVRQYINDGKKHTICGRAVSTKKHEKGHVFINLDKKFPNQIFSVSIFNSSIQNFDYEPQIYLKDKNVCFTGKVSEYKGTASMIIDNGKQVRLVGEY